MRWKRQSILITSLLGAAALLLAAHTAMDFQLSSPAFANQQTIPDKYTCHGAGVSPPLRWQGTPAGTRSFALILHDPDAPAPGGFTHWVLYNLPASLTEIPSGTYTEAKFPLGGLEGDNGRGELGFTPSCPPPGAPHHYTFTLYAVSVPSLGLAAGAAREDVLRALQGKIVAQTQLVGVYRTQ